MSIRQRQLKLRRDYHLRTALAAGQIPKGQSIEQSVERDFAVRSAGLPRTMMSQLRNGQVALSADWEARWASVRLDLETAFAEARAQRDDQLALVTYYDTERRRLERATARVSGRLRAQLAGGAMADSFTDFQYVDLVGDAERGIPETTAQVHLERHEATLPLAQWHRIDLSAAQIQVQVMTDHSAYRAAPSERLTSDAVTAPWTIQVSGAGARCEVVLSFELPKPQAMTRIVLKAHSPGSQAVELQLGSTGAVVSPMGDEPFVWEFPEQAVERFQLRLIKNEPDEATGNEATWTLGALPLSASRLQYQESAVLVSTPLTAIAMYGLAKVEADIALPPGTAMRTFIAQDVPGAPLSWREANSGWVDFGIYQQQRMRVQPNNPGTGPLYMLATVTTPPVAGSVVVRSGLEMWQREHLPMPVSPGLRPTLRDWVGASPLLAYVPVMTAALEVPVGLCRFRLYLTMGETRSVTLTPTAQAGMTWTMMVNGDEVASERDISRIVTLPAGAVRLEILTQTPAGAEPGWLRLQGLYPLELTAEVYGSAEVMKQVSIQQLRYGTKSGDRTRFAIDGTVFYVTYDPREGAFGATSLPHQLVFQTINEGAVAHPIRVMIRLTGDSAQSPRLRSYRLLTR